MALVAIEDCTGTANANSHAILAAEKKRRRLQQLTPAAGWPLITPPTAPPREGGPRLFCLCAHDFSGTNWHGSSFAFADLRGSDFSRADLSGCDFTGAWLDDADFSDADLRNVRKLVGAQLTGCELKRAQLPETIANWPPLEQVKELSQAGAKVFFALLSVCAFSLIAMVSGKDVDFVTGTRGAKLPLIDTEIPLLPLYATLPVLLIAVYLYLHLYLQRLWETLIALPAIFPDGRRLDEATFPWLLNDLCRDHMRRIKADRPLSFHIQSGISRFFAGGLVPIVLFILWANGLRLHNAILTGWHVFAVVSTLAVGAYFSWSMRRIFAARSKRRKISPGLGLQLKFALAWWLLVALFLGMRSWSRGVFEAPDMPSRWTQDGEAESFWHPFERKVSWGRALANVAQPDPKLESRGACAWGPHLLLFFRIRPWLDLDNRTILPRPPTWSGREENFVKELAQVAPTQFSEASAFRHIHASGTFLARATFQDCDLTGAQFDYAVLDGVNFRQCILRRAYLQHARFSPSRTVTLDTKGIAELKKLFRPNEELQWSKCDFFRVSLAHAALDGAKVYGCYFRRADLSGATLAGARFEDCDFRDASFEGADLSGTVFIHCEFGQTVFRGAFAFQTSFEACHFGTCQFDGARIVDATFRFQPEGLPTTLQNALTLFQTRWVIGELKEKQELSVPFGTGRRSELDQPWQSGYPLNQ